MGTTADTLLASAVNMDIPVSMIVAGLNDRTKFHPAELETLAAHIAAVGLAQPPLYRRLGTDRYQIIAGERRTRAMRDLLHWPAIPARVVECDDQTAIKLMGAENRNRVNLDPMDDANSYQNVINLFGWSVAEVAAGMGVSTRAVTDRLALLKLCEEAQDLVSKPQSGFTVGYALILANAGLDRNFQNQALDLLKINKAPTVDWFKGIVAELIGKCKQNSMWNPDDFLVMAQQVEVQNATVLPDPETAEAPTNGATAEEILRTQAEWWNELATQWQAKNKAQAKICRANARNCRQSADLIARFAAMAPVVSEPEPWTIPEWAAIPVPMAQPPVDPAPVSDVVAVDPLVGRTRSKCDQCGAKRATHQIARRQATGDGQRKRTVLTNVCNACLPPGVASLIGPAPQQLEFVAVAA